MITEDILYYAKFPAKTGVLKNFKRSNNPSADYTSLKSQVEALPDTSLIPEIEDFLFSTNEEVVAERIRNIKSYFMLFQYGIVRSPAPGRSGARNTTMASSLIIARQHSKNATDTVEEMLHMEKTLQFIVQVANQMKTDNKTLFCAADRFAENSIDIAPVEPALIYGCVGWVMTFNKNKFTLVE